MKINLLRLFYLAGEAKTLNAILLNRMFLPVFIILLMFKTPLLSQVNSTYTDVSSFIAAAPDCEVLFENYDSYNSGTQIYSLFDGALQFNSPNIPTIFYGAWNLQGTAGEFSGAGLLPHNPYNTLAIEFPTPVFGFGSKAFNDYSGIWQITLSVTTVSGQVLSVSENINTTGDVGFLGATSSEGIVSATFTMSSPSYYAFELDLTRLILFETTYYADQDNDGYGDGSQSLTSCAAPIGYVSNNLDCDDNDPDNFPGNAEVCDGYDNTCDGVVDEGTTDSDNDGICNEIDECPSALPNLTNFNTTTCNCELGFFPTTTEINGETIITGCQICPAGSYCPDGTNQILCPAGQFQGSPGAVECQLCAAGTFQGSEGAIECESCPAGSFQGNSGATECIPCAAGSYSETTGAVECMLCPAGSAQSNIGATECPPCGLGTFSNEPGSAECTLCPAGSFSGANGSTECELCPAGSYQGSIGASQCDQCGSGTFSGEAGATECTPCPAGSYMDSAGAVECVLCPAGSFSATAGSGHCSICAVNTFSENPGSTNCEACLPETSSQTGAASCFPDVDSDFVEDAEDNCPTVPNPDQTDTDGDGFGLACDCDDNSSNIHPSAQETCGNNIDDNCNGQVDEGCAGDTDGDGILDNIDNCINIPNPAQTDSDCDGVGNACDQWPGCDDNADSDNDGIPDCVDLNEMTNWACGNNGTKVTVCHIPPGNPANRHEICISPNAVPAHLGNHGDYIGECDQIVCPQNMMAPTSNSTVSTGFQLYPNPAKGTLHLDLHDYLDHRISVFIFNQLGQRVFHLPEQELSDPHLTIDLARLALPDGIYLLAVRTAEGLEGRQFVIAR